MEPQPRLIELGTAIADGTPVDWTDAESHAVQPSEQAVVRNLRLVERIAQVHASLPSPDRGSPLVDSLLHPTTGVTVPVDGPVAWGPLTILDRIGRGTFGDVYRARDPRLDRPVALKLLRRRENDPEALETAVIEEGRLLARVRHPNVVTVYGAERIDGRAGLWMEFVDGETLEAELRRRGPFDASDIVGVGIDLCRALGAVHQAGLLHRDLKAQNAMRDAAGRVVLTDFGAGRELAETNGNVGGELAGTPLYLAPEVLSGHPASTASDIYSLGVLLFHLATGSFPVRGRSLRDLRDSHARRARSSLRATRPDLSAALVGVIERAIEPDSSRRYQRAEDLEQALERVARPAATRVRRFAMVAAIALVFASAATLPSLWHRMASSATNALGGHPPGSTLHPGVVPERTVNIRRLDVPNLNVNGQLSQDAQYLPYTGTDDAGRLMLLDIASGKTRVLASDPPQNDAQIEFSVVSPDDGQVAYSWESGPCGCTELRTVDTQGVGNPPRSLVRQEKPGWVAPVDWSRDGTEILAVRWTDDRKFQIVLVSALDGTLRVVKGGLEDVFTMHLSPDGQFVAYDYPVAADNYARDIAIVPTDGSEEIPLVIASSYDAYPMWTPDGRGVVFASDRSGSLGLWLAPVQAGRPQGPPVILQKDMGRIRPTSLASNGTLLYARQSGSVDVYMARLGPDGTIVPDSVVQAAGDFLGSNMDPDWAPDGHSIVYVSQRRPVGPRDRALVVRALETGEQRALWPDLGAFIEPRWSPDGRSILVRGGNRRGVSGTWRLDARTGSILSSFGWVVSTEWAPNGRSFFSIPVASGFKRVQRTDVTSGRTRDVYQDADGGVIGRLAVAPDGKSVAVQVGTPRTVRLIVAPVSGSAPHEVARFTEDNGFRALQQWTRDGANLLFTRRIEKPVPMEELWSVPADGGAPHSLHLVKDRMDYVRVSPDGERIVFRTGRPFWDLWLMDNVLNRTPADQR